MKKFLCYSCEYLGTDHYRSKMTYGDIPIVIDTVNPTVPGSEYELLIKGLWAGTQTKQAFLDEMKSFATPQLELGE